MIWKNIKSMLKTTPALFCFIMVSQIAGVIIILFSYVIYVNNKYSIDTTYDEGKEFSVEFVVTENSEITEKIKKAFPEMLSEYESILEECMVDLSFIPEPVEYYDSGEPVRTYIQSRFSVKDGKYIETDLIPQEAIEGRIFNDDDSNEGKYVCLLSYTTWLEHGDKIVIDGKTYEVVGREKESLSRGVNHGIFFMRELIRMPLEVIPENVDTAKISIYFTKVLTADDYKNLNTAFSETFGSDILVMTEGYEVDNEVVDSLKTMMIAVFFMALISAYSNIKIYNYLMEKRKNMTAVYLVCGATRLKACGIYLGEVVISQLICTLLGMWLFKIAVIPALLDKYIWVEVIFESTSYYKLVLIYVVVVAVISALTVWINTLKTPMQIFRNAR